MRRTTIVGLVILAASALPAYADVVFTLTATDANGAAVTGPVSPGETITVDVSMAVDAANDPLTSVRAIVLDLTHTSDSITTSGFTWTLDELLTDATMYLPFGGADSLQPSIVYGGRTAVDGFILDLTTTPVRVATFDATVNDAGTLDVLGSAGEASVSTASVDAGFNPRVTFTVADGTLVGGLLDLTVSGATDGSGGGNSGATDGTGTDTGTGTGTGTDTGSGTGTGTGTDTGSGTGTGSGNGSDNGSNTGSGSGSGTGSALCGAGAAPAMLLLFLTFGCVRRRRRF